MNVDDPFIKDAINAALKMLLIPLVFALVFIQVVDRLVGVHMGWQDIARGATVLIWLYVIVMWQRYRRYFQ